MITGRFRPKGPFPLYLHELDADTRGWTERERMLYLRLLEGDTPTWLRQVELPASLAENFRLYEVRG